MAEPAVAATVLVPGLPHLLAAKPAAGWRTLAHATEALGEELRAAGTETLVVVSTQWMSVLGIQVQMRPTVAGRRVDENWYPYDFGTLDFSFETDVPLAERWLEGLRKAGFQARPTDHPHFPVDTGVIVAKWLLDPHDQFRIAQASLNLYGTPESVEQLGATAAAAARELGRRVAFVAVSQLSSQPIRTWIEPGEDRLASPVHDRWNRRVLDLLATGAIDTVFDLRAEYAAAATADSQLRALSFLHGATPLGTKADIRAYAPIWGMGGAVVIWPREEKRT